MSVENPQITLRQIFRGRVLRARLGDSTSSLACRRRRALPAVAAVAAFAETHGRVTSLPSQRVEGLPRSTEGVAETHGREEENWILFWIGITGERVKMDSKHVVMSALGLGIGVGMGLGLAGSQTFGKWAGLTTDMIEEELMRLVMDGRESKVTFNEFPYYLSLLAKVLIGLLLPEGVEITAAAVLHYQAAELVSLEVKIEGWQKGVI